jgi:DNA-directed RNA polymerase beta subunit
MAGADLTAPEPELFDPLDYDGVRKRIYNSVADAALKSYPKKNERFTLSLVNPQFDGPEETSLAEQKAAILERRSLQRKLKGTWQLVDNKTGKVVDQKNTVVAHVPIMTQRGTFVLGGNEYTVANQMRLRSGVYARQKDSGEFESHVNVVKGGPSFRIFMEPKSGEFRMSLGQSNLRLYPILKSLGVPDKDMQSAWGNDIWSANAAKSEDPRALHTLYSKLMRKRAAADVGQEDITATIKSAMEKMELDPDVTTRTLGVPYKNVNSDMVLRASQKLLNISRGKEDTDDRDSLANQHLMSVEQLLAERFMRDSGRVGAGLLWKATLRGNLSGVPHGALNPHINSVFYGSGLSMPLEEINPTDAMDQNMRITRMGEGGIPSYDAVPLNARGVQPSYMNFVDPVKTPESMSAGVDNRLAYGVRRDKDGAIYSRMLNVKTGKPEWVSATKAAGSVLAFPGELDLAKKSGSQSVRSLVDGRVRQSPLNKVDYAAIHASGMFSPVTNAVPMISAMKAQRVSMGSRFLSQALPLEQGESPLVQSADEEGKSFYDMLGDHSGNARAKTGGQVVDVNKNGITVLEPGGVKKTYELYENFPFNRKSGISSVPLVRPGDTVQPGQLLAHSNFTDKSGAFATGKNLNVGYMVWGGNNHEDAYVISQSAAKKLSSEHTYVHKADAGDFTETGLNKFISLFPTKYQGAQLKNMQEDGTVKPGTIVNEGDPLLLAVDRRTVKGAGELYRGAKSNFMDSAVEWSHPFPGIVTDVFNDDEGTKVAVKAIVPSEVGDKMSNRYGSKGVIAEIVPDDRMPHDSEGNPLDVLANPQGLITRVNPAQIYEAILGKVAAKTGKSYKLPGFRIGEDLGAFVENEARKAGVNDTEDVTIPENNRKVNGVLVGKQWFMKLSHTAESKSTGRGLGAYTAEGEPTTGADGDKPKRVGMGEMSALISHGAIANIRDVKMVRGQKNEDYWKAMMTGRPLPTPEVPMIYKKFISQLEGAGINVKRQGSSLHLTAMTDKDVEAISRGEVKNPSTVRWYESYGREALGEKSMEPIEGGLFDRGLTGGHGGSAFSHIQLSEPMPSPVMEDGIRSMLDLTKDGLREVLAGRQKLPDGGTGGEGMKNYLAKINIDNEINRWRGEFKDATSVSRRDAAAKKLKTFQALKDTNVSPADLMITKVPVLPPLFRPITATSKFDIVSGVNELYRELLIASDNLKKTSATMEGDPVGNARLATYDSLKAVTGLGDPVKPEHQQRHIRGILGDVFGSSPKLGVMQRRLLGTSVELAGRAVITPNPELTMDQIGLPEEQAWTLYGPFVARRLAKAMGDTPDMRLEAVRQITDRTPKATRALLDEMEHRPVVSSRAPMLHRYSVMGFMPVLTHGKTLQLPPQVLAGLGGDFDGDTMNFHVVVADDAVKEAKEKLLASKNLKNPADFGPNFAPRQEFLEGLWLASTRKDAKKQTMVFGSKSEALQAFRSGKIGIDQPIVIR